MVWQTVGRITNEILGVKGLICFCTSGSGANPSSWQGEV